MNTLTCLKISLSFCRFGMATNCLAGMKGRIDFWSIKYQTTKPDKKTDN